MGYRADIAEQLRDLEKGLTSESEILDVGCGTQTYRHLFEGHRYTGIDVEESGRDASGKTPDRYFDGQHLPFRDSSFELILCTEVLEHAPRYRELIQEMRRAVKPGGKIFVTVPFMWGEHEMPYDFRRFTSVGIKTCLESAGLTVVSQSKSIRGLDAVDQLMRSEINSYLNRRFSHNRLLWLIMRVLDLPARLLWSVLAAYRSLLYRFERIYIRNMLVAEKTTEMP